MWIRREKKEKKKIAIYIELSNKLSKKCFQIMSRYVSKLNILKNELYSHVVNQYHSLWPWMH